MKPVSIGGVGSLTINPSGVWGVQTRTVVAANVNLEGQLRLNSGSLAVNTGSCTGSISFFGDLEINGDFDYNNCKPNGNGTLYYNANSATSYLLKSENYTLGALTIGGSSIVVTDTNGFNLNSNLNVVGNGVFIITATSTVKGDINLGDSGSLYLNGTSTVLKGTNVIFSDTFNLHTQADSSSSSQLTSTANMKVGGNLDIFIPSGTPVLDSIVILNYASQSGSFSSINAQSDQDTYYTGTYNSNQAVATKGTRPSSTSTSAGSSSSSSSGSSTGHESNGSTMMTVSMISVLLLSLLVL